MLASNVFNCICYALQCQLTIGCDVVASNLPDDVSAFSAIASSMVYFQTNFYIYSEEENQNGGGMKRLLLIDTPEVYTVQITLFKTSCSSLIFCSLA